MDEKTLAAQGLTGSEAKIYKAAIKARMATPVVLAKMTGIKRTTAYHIAQMLAEKGLLVEDATKRPRVFVPASARDIELLIEREHRVFAARKQTLRDLADEISRVTAEQTYPVPHIRFVEEEKLERFLYTATLKWHTSMFAVDATWWGFQDHTFLEQFGKITEWYWKRTKEPIAVKLLSNESLAEKRFTGKFPQRSIKYWKNAKSFVTTKWVVGDYVIMVNTRRHPFYLVEIHDTTFANDEREVFKNLWSLVEQRGV